MTKGIILAALLLAPAAARAEGAEAGMPKEMMENMAAYGGPGPEHARFKDAAGKWNTVSRGWMKPGDKPMESKGIAAFRWILGGRFLEQKFKGDMAGQPFEGVGYLGYDRIKKRYESVWMDNMSTGVLLVPGTWNEQTKTLVSEGTYSNPMTGRPDEWTRMEWTLKDKNTQVFVMWAKDEKGAEFKSMELIYTRQK